MARLAWHARCTVNHMRNLTVAILGGLALQLLACGAAAPPVWYEGDQTNWTLPIVEAEAPELVVSATIHGQGPYLFLLDPDSSWSAIDSAVAEELGLFSNNKWLRVVNQKDTSLPRKAYEVMSVQSGDLRFRNVRMLGVPAGSLDVGGKAVAGLLGANILSRTIVINADRDAGVVRLALTGNASLPSDAIPVKGKLHHGALYVPVRLNENREVVLRVVLASRHSTLRREVARDLHLPAVSTREVIVDNTGTPQTVADGTRAGLLQVDGFAMRDVVFLDHAEKRSDIYGNRAGGYPFDGFLGQNVLSRFNVVVDRDHATLWIAPRRAGPSPSAAVIARHTR